jgi:hypothetical protein
MDASKDSSRDSSADDSKDTAVAYSLTSDAAVIIVMDAAAEAKDTGSIGIDSGADALTDASVAKPKPSCERAGEVVLKDLSGFERCSSCPDARCIPSALVTIEGADKLALCDDGKGKCVPDKYMETAGFFLLKTCVSVQGAEGRCLSTCIPEVAVQKDRLPQDVCAQEERCAPCYDPVTGQDTESCRVGCDQGPTQPAVRFTSCCQESGMCVPKSLIGDALGSFLGADICSEDDALCVPNAYYDVKGFELQKCSAMGGAEGRCIASCIPLVAKQADRLVKDSCADGSLCAPCFDPVSGKATGACTLSNDKPSQAPYLFPKCCGGLAACVPKAIIPANQRGMLGVDSCKGTDQLCIPDEFANPDGFVPPTCSSWKGAEGRCLPDCLPGVAEIKGRLTKDVCANGYLCAPCYDPVTGKETEACHAVSDSGPKKPKVVFDRCCGDLSVCVPQEAVAEKDRPRFNQGGCPSDGFLCVPEGMARGAVPPSCESWDHAEARCLPTCLPDVTKQAPRVAQESCAEGNLCVPCFDPVNGDDTHACSSGSDKPTQQPVVRFEECCSGISSCVPTRAVQEKDRPNLDANTCTQKDDHLCLPDNMALDPLGYGPAPTCRSWGGGEGRCLPACLPAVAANKASLTPGGCASNYLCSPCNDPLTGAPTSACTGNNDTGPQSNQPYLFPKCCDVNGFKRGTCLPRALAGAQGSTLLAETCPTGQSDDFVCAPDEKIKNPAYHFQTCAVSSLLVQLITGSSSGACLSSCMVPSNLSSYLAQDGCTGADELCTPCKNLNGASSGACE